MKVDFVSFSGQVSRTIFFGLLSLYMMPVAFADDAANSATSAPNRRAAYQQCAAENGEDRKKIGACMANLGYPRRHHHHHFAAFKKCAAENGITLPAKGSGQSLSQADRQTIHQCVAKARAAASVQN